MLNKVYFQLRRYTANKQFSFRKKIVLSDDMTKLVPISEDAVNFAVKLLKEGELIALPSDTVYGLAADIQNSSAIEKLYKVKGRNFNKPIAICISKVEDINLWGLTDQIEKELLYKLLPGPVTVLLNRTDWVNFKLNPGFDKIGIRIPDNKFINNVTEKFGSAIALTSANLSNQPSTLCPEEFKTIWPYVGAVFDGGKIGENKHSRAGSTIVDLSNIGSYKIIRNGSALNKTISVLHSYGLIKI